MAKTAHKQSQRSLDTRNALMRSAIETIREMGYANPSSSEIARRANVTRGAQVHRYTNKQQLVLAIVDYHFEHVESQFEKIATRLSEPDYQLEDFIQDLWHELFSPEFHDIALEFITAARTDQKLHDKLEQKWTHMLRAYEKSWYKILKRQGLFTVQMEMALDMTLFILRGMAFERILRGGGKGEYSALLEKWSAIVTTLVTETEPPIKQ